MQSVFKTITLSNNVNVLLWYFYAAKLDIPDTKYFGVLQIIQNRAARIVMWQISAYDAHFLPLIKGLTG